MAEFLKRIGVTAGVLLAVIFSTFLSIKFLNLGLALMSQPSDWLVLAGGLSVAAAILLSFASLGTIGLLVAKKYFYSKK